jgi:hypothetical protein
MYGNQNFDRKLVYNTYIVASEPWFKSSTACWDARLAAGNSLRSSPPGPDRPSIATRGTIARLGCRRWGQLLRERAVRLHLTLYGRVTPRISA